MGGLETGNTYRENEFAMQQLPGKRWEVGNGTVPSNSISPPRGVSDHLFVEDLAKSKLLYGDIPSSLFLFTPIIPWFFPTPWCNIWFPGTEGTQESKGGAEKWVNGVPRSSPNLKSQHGWDMHPQKTKEGSWIPQLGNVFVWWTVPSVTALITHALSLSWLYSTVSSAWDTCQFSTID